MNVIVVAPHPDDESLGCGGVIANHVSHEDRVDVVFLTSGELALKHLDAREAWRVREGEAGDAAAVLGVADLTFLRQPDWYLSEHAEESSDQLVALLGARPPDRLFVPHEQEWHPDHRAAHSIALRALRRCRLPDSVLLRYEVWTPLASYDHVEDVTASMDRKLAAIDCYVSQQGAFDFAQAATGLARYRGALAARTAYAEVFLQYGEALNRADPET